MTITSRWLPSVPDVTEDSWHQPWSEPPRRKSALAAIALMASGLFSPVIQPAPAAASTIPWSQRLSEPARTKSDHRTLRDRSTFVGRAVHIGWFSGLSEPVRIRTGLKTNLQQNFAFPPVFQATTVDIGWFGPLSEPVKKRSGLESRLWVYYQLNPLPITPAFGWFNSLEGLPRQLSRAARTDQAYSPFFQTETVTVDKWFKAFAEPPGSKRGLYAASQQALAFYPFPFPPTAAPSIDYGQLSEPVRARPDRGALRDRATFIGRAVHIGWFGGLSEPVRVKQGLGARYQQSLALHPFTPAAVTDISFSSRFNEPVRLKPGLHAAYQQALAFYPFPFPPVAVPFGWFSQSSDPTRAKPSLISTRDAENQWEAVAATMEWFSPLAEPFPVKRGLGTKYQQALAFYPFPFPPAAVLAVDYGALSEPVRARPDNDALRDRATFIGRAVHVGWFGPLSEPARVLTGLKSYLQRDFTFPPVTPSAVIVNNGWFTPLAEPVRRKPLAASDRQIQPVFPIIPSYGWFKGWDDFARKKPSVLGPQFVGFSPSPFIPSYGWYARLTEPVRKKPKVWEGIFEARPPAALVTTYAASMDATEQGDLFLGLLSRFNAPVVALVDIIENDPRHRGNMGIIETDPESGILASIVEPETVPSTGTPVSTVAGARIAIIIS